MTKRIIDPKETATRDMHQFLLGSVSPRPIAFVSTVDEDGNTNLAPYSFFNAFSSNPPLLVFSSNRRVRDNTTKDTLANVISTKEAVINVVSHDIVRNMTISAVEFPSDVSEFAKAGLTPVKSQMVSPPRVKESPVNMECKVKDIITLGDKGGAGHLILCEVVLMHINEEVIDENNRIDPHKIDLMGRMGRAFYVRASGENVYPIVQTVTPLVIGYDKLPEYIRTSKELSAHDIAVLASATNLPTKEEIDQVEKRDNPIKSAQYHLAQGEKTMALSILMNAHLNE
jgi:flavin reductase (DIM6/NTAB) family NADH-FMN oxidoreductase RutF